MGLSLSRRIGESIVINDDLEILLYEIKSKISVRLVIFGDSTKYRVYRRELLDNPELLAKLEAARARNRDGKA